MLGFGWLSLRQIAEALRAGRLEEAQRLLDQPALRGNKRAYELHQQLARAFVERGERELRGDDATAAWNDLLRAEQVGVKDGATGKLRLALTRLGVAEARALLEAGEPARALEAIGQLRQRQVDQPELKPLEEAAKEWKLARELGERGEFPLALDILDRVRRLLTTPLGSLERYQEQLTERRDAVHQLVLRLHEAAAGEQWHEVLRVSDQVLAAAPQHAEARKVRARAWKAVEPATEAGVTRNGTPAIPAKEGKATHYLLWIDQVGGFLICLNERVTLGQAVPDNDVDVALMADVSRLHAALTRDQEGGYILEAFRPVQVNGKPAARALLRSGDRVTLGNSCQFQFRQPVPLSGSARLDLVSGHRLRLALDGILLMGQALVLGSGPQVHVTVPALRQPVKLIRTKDGFALQASGALTVNGQVARDRATWDGAATVACEDLSLSLEPVNAHLERV